MCVAELADWLSSRQRKLHTCLVQNEHVLVTLEDIKLIRNLELIRSIAETLVKRASLLLAEIHRPSLSRIDTSLITLSHEDSKLLLVQALRALVRIKLSDLVVRQTHYFSPPLFHSRFREQPCS